MNNTIRKEIADLETSLNKDEYKQLNKTGALLAFLLEMTKGKTEDSPLVDHPYHNEKFKKYNANIDSYIRGNGKKDGSICFGDSLFDIPREKYTAIKEKMNFSVSGSWSHHIVKMQNDVSVILNSYQIVPAQVYVGSMLGNPLLSYQTSETSVKEAIACLNNTRRLFPTSRITILGLPPAYNMNIVRNRFYCELSLLKWAVDDLNANYLEIRSKLKPTFGILPNVQYSSDGVHFTPKSVHKVDAYLWTAKDAPITKKII